LTEVILVDEDDVQTGTMEKMEAHLKGVLHRAFSIFIFNSRGEFLLQQRALGKYHNGGIWSNTCCSHPLPGEAVINAANRRLFEEMGFSTPLSPAFHFIYNANFPNGLTEHEYDHVFTGIYDGKVNANKSEVNDYCFKKISDVENSVLTHPQKYSEWFKIALPKIRLFHEKSFHLL
jgi:isopentenyl-diphosphate Delta-isomerase